MAQPSRIEEARRRLRRTRFGVGAAAAAGFAVFAFAARAAHPGTSHASQTATVTQQASSSYDDDATDSYGLDFGSGSIGPSTGGAAVQSGGS